jgi:hypothetical protein
MKVNHIGIELVDDVCEIAAPRNRRSPGTYDPHAGKRVDIRIGSSVNCEVGLDIFERARGFATGARDALGCLPRQGCKV